MRSRRLSILLACLLCLGACDKAGEVVDKALALVGLGDSAKQDNKDKKEKKGKKVAVDGATAGSQGGEGQDGDEGKDATAGKGGGEGKGDDNKAAGDDGDGADTGVGGDDDGNGTVPAPQDVQIERRTEKAKQKAKKKDLKSVTAPEFTVDAPVHVLKRVGGSARFMIADEEYVYLDFPQHFGVYSLDLKKLARIPLSESVLEIKKENIGGKTTLFLKEDKNWLEILTLEKGEGGAVTLTKVDTYDMGGHFVVLEGKSVVNFDKDKIEIWDFSDPANAKIRQELPVGDGNDVIALGKQLYLSRQGFLDILKSDDLSLLSTVRIGKKFGFLGLSEEGGKKNLLLSLLSASGALKGIQMLRLNDDVSGVTDFGQTLVLAKELTKFTHDLKSGLIIGQEIPEGEGTGPIQLFSLKEGRFLRGVLSSQTNLQAWSIARSRMYLATNLEITINDVVLRGDIIAKQDVIKGMGGKKPANTPLAQLGSTKTVLDEYDIIQQKKIEFMADSRKIALLDPNHFLLFELSQDQKSHRVYGSSNFEAADFTLTEIVVPEPLYYDRILPTDFGVVLYPRGKTQLHFIGADLKTMQKLPIERLQNLSSWLWYTGISGEVIITASEKPTGGKIAPKEPPKAAPKPKFKPDTTVTDTASESALDEGPKPFVIQAFELKSPQQVTLMFQIDVAERPFLARNDDGDLVVLSSGGIAVYDIRDLVKPQLKGDSSVRFEGAGYDFVDAKISLLADHNPLDDRLYGLYRDAGVLKILVMPVLDPEKAVIMQDFDITPEEFQGMTFAKGGYLLLLPGFNEGTLFYDVSNLSEINEVAHWDLPSSYVSIGGEEADHACVALGSKGVYCGNLLY